MVSIYANTFHFLDPSGKDPVPCEMRIEVNEIISNRLPHLEQLPTTYQIVMHSNYIKNDENGNQVYERINSFGDVRKHQSHPFCNLKYILYLYVMSVVKNDMTTQMIKFMMMNDQELSQHTGTTTPKKYRRDILIALTTFIE